MRKEVGPEDRGHCERERGSGTPLPPFFLVVVVEGRSNSKKKKNKTTNPDGTVRVAAVAKSCAKPYINGRGGGEGGGFQTTKKKPSPMKIWIGDGDLSLFFLFFLDWTTTI